jgi:hypothetical protein
MILVSRTFVRKRAISLATSASVAATSLALAQDPSRSITLALPAPGHAEQAKDIARHEGNGPYC